MFELNRRYPFARVDLALGSSREPNVEFVDRPIRSELPMGMHVESCLLSSVVFDAEEDEEVEINLTVSPEPNWTIGWATGEWLNAFELDHTDGDAAAVAMRDPEWFRYRFDLKLIESDGKEGRFSASYRAQKLCQIRLELAAAQTYLPKNDNERVSPWFAVDNALNASFQD